MFSIITPTFNRAHTLHRVYQSLTSQTFKDFQWIIVDDFSTDNTATLVGNWIKVGVIKIEYLKLNENMGKAHAVNFGLTKCTENITIIADSDDSFDTNTLEDLCLIWTIIKVTHLSEKIASVWTMTKDINGVFVGDLFPKDFWQVGFKERVLENNIKGEKWASWDTSILKTTQMYAQKKLYIEESHTWNIINKKYDFICLNIAHRTYFDSPDGIMATKICSSENAKRKFYNSYYGLHDIDFKKGLLRGYYRELMFQHVSAMIYFKDVNYRFKFGQYLICLLAFLLMIPGRLFQKLL